VTALSTADFLYRARAVQAAKLGAVDEPGVPGGLGRQTYGELMRRCDGFVEALDRMGIGQGERIALVSPNSVKFLIALWATTGSGRVLVPINFRLDADEVAYIVEDAEASLLLVDAELAEKLEPVKAPRRVVLDGEDDAELFAPSESGREWPGVEEDAPATLNYTSGTTAAPKGVILSQRSAALNASAVGWGFGLSEADRYLHTLPMFHVNGWGLPLAAAALGVPQVVQREVRGPSILERVDAEGITLLCGATPVAGAIESAAADLREAGTPVPGEGTARMVSGGAPTPAPAIAHFEAATGWELIHAYGLTECGPVLTVNRVLPEEGLAPAERAERLAAAGTPVIGARLKVDSEGQILARTAKAMSGYWRQPDLSAAAFEGEWLRTGDGGELIDGMLHITDRKKDMIVTGGENVSSLQVESCLLEHPDVADAAVIGVPHERWGETPKAIVVLHDGATLDQEALIAFTRERLAHFKCPTVVEARDSLPRTATGKVQKYLLRADG
jgi:fatty-acyl-CoA synthase